jgi:LPXTG-site transpeptidase (sortase) family protein
VAAHWFSGVRVPADWRRRLVGVGLIGIGVVGVGGAGWVYYDAYATRETWEASPEAAALARQDAEPTPIWIAPATPQPFADQYIEPVPTAGALPPLPMLVPALPTPVVTATANQLSLDATDFRFLDPPEPGAHARVAVTVANHADVPSGRVLLGINSAWFEGYSIIGTAPAVSQDRTDEEGLRTFSFPPVAAGATVNFELHVSSLDEGTRAPSLTVLLENGDLIGQVAKPSTFAPPPRPGPVMSVDIPRLKLHSGVVQTAWEPPPFTVGQIKGSANVTQGNTVLIGHLTGAAGNVFAHLDQLRPGDEITTISRGLPYRFVVSQTFEGPNTDATPMQPDDDDPRITLMTCAGIWNPFTHDYSERLWVVAEPPDQAAVTIANAAATATVVSATATAQATLDAAATATAVAGEPTATPVPTPYAGEPSLAGGIGNTRANVEMAFGFASGETSGKLVVFRATGREVRVRFTPDPPRAALVAENFSTPLAFEAAVRESRRLFPTDTQPRIDAPEGNGRIVVERFASSTLGQALGAGSGDFSVVYSRDPGGAITSLVIGLGDDLDAMIADSRR